MPTPRSGRMLFSALCLVGATAAVMAGIHFLGTGKTAIAGAGNTPIANAAATDLDRRFAADMHPFLQTYCISCHSGPDPKSALDLSYKSTGDVTRDSDRFALIISRVKNGDMPPRTAPKHPSDTERANAVSWMQTLSRQEALRHAGDPGPVLAHRLSNAEYNYVIRDLTGVDIQPTREFPVDPANQAGFDNTGESLNMEPELLKKYMEAARAVSEHMVLKTDGLDFATHPVIAVTDRDKYCVNRIIAFYERQPTSLAQYFLAAWRYQNRAALGKPDARLEDFGRDLKISNKYLQTIWTALSQPAEATGPTAALQALWKALPAPTAEASDATDKACAAIEEWVWNLRSKVRPNIPNLQIPGMQTGSQPFVIWKDRQQEATRFTYAPGSALKLTGSDLAPNTAGAAAMAIPTDPAARTAYEAAFTKFCTVFPDAFYISERTRTYLDAASEEKADRTGRLLSAGLHSQTGYFRDDRPLYELLLTADEQHQLDAMWKDFDIITDAPVRQFQSMIWFERSDSKFMKTPDFNFVRTEDHEITQEPKYSQMKNVFLADARKASNNSVAIGALVDYFDSMNATFRAMEKNRKDAEPLHLAALQDFAARAYRRPLSPAEKDSMIAFYKQLRTEDGLEHEDALRDSLVSILMSPNFLYRLTTPASQTSAAGVQTQPLSDLDLASRLSFFLWSSVPDRDLLKHATAGDLHSPDVLLAQAHRMLKDDRITALATEFGGNWLDFRRFEEHNGVDRDRFKTFDNTLRESMFQEPIRFLTDLAKSDRSILDCLFADYTFVNAPLARHYGMPIPAGNERTIDTWWRVDNAGTFDRGGLLPMAVFMTKNAPGLRTSPVKRGYWLVHRILGEEIAPPPPNVPVLPSDESKLGDLTLPQLLAKHREDPSCATCHIHFDAVGLAFEGFGPIGELRKTDMGGKPVENKAAFRDGSEGVGLAGLRTYIKSQRQADFLDNFCRKLLANALGRTLILPDDLLVEKMLASLDANGYRFSSLVDVIVTSPQFLNTRALPATVRKDNAL